MTYKFRQVGVAKHRAEAICNQSGVHHFVSSRPRDTGFCGMVLYFLEVSF